MAQRKGIPSAKAPIVDREGRVSPEWLKFFSTLSADTGTVVVGDSGAREAAEDAAASATSAASSAQSAANAASTAENAAQGITDRLDFEIDFGMD